MKKFFICYNNIFTTASRVMQPIFLFAIRAHVSWVFFKAGLNKIQSWETTLYLFEEEYKVPVIGPHIAAYLATAGELVLPVALTLGIVSRLSALGLFILNVVAVISYPLLWEMGFYDHQLWGLALFIVVLWGPGKLSLDYLLCKQLRK
ncbi:MAG: DoxX family protein [Bdellovibrionaceae bacterium]|nr:DoxX family protein [Pseudobdellovibrionaceae bacterium]